MAVSKKRKTTAYKPPRRAGKVSKNPRWFAPTMGAFYIVGLLWILIYYVSQARYPMDVGNANLLIGFGFMFVGFIMTTRWQ